MTLAVVGTVAFAIGRDLESGISAEANEASEAPSEEPSVDYDSDQEYEELQPAETYEPDEYEEETSSPEIAGRSNPNDTPTPKWETGLDLVRDQTDVYDDWSDSEIGRETQLICERLDTEYIEDIVLDLATEGGDSECGALISLATNNTCGEHQAEIDAYLD